MRSYNEKRSSILKIKKNYMPTAYVRFAMQCTTEKKQQNHIYFMLGT